MITPENDGINYFERSMVFVVMPIIWDYIPILIVLFIHYKNVVSVNRLLKLTQVSKVSFQNQTYDETEYIHKQ